MLDFSQKAVGCLERIRSERPLVHLITNLVTMEDVANVLLALGARPIMAQAQEEVDQITRASRALVLNLGTPMRERIEAMKTAARAAQASGIPIVFDPVGVGASSFRLQAVRELFDSSVPAIVRGNAGEIGALAGLTGTLSGVDTANAEYDRAAVARALAIRYCSVIVVAGARDYVSDGKRTYVVANTSARLQTITGAGDMQSALIAAAASVEPDALLAAVSALVLFGLAAQRAASRTMRDGPGSFRVALFDALAQLDAGNIS
ncbi:MAG: hydroxyethylthiazole kinase [Chloroflexi bacterium]|nr:hydroxyethylthiazole kinase [Chloroflexota bacterium]